MARAAGHPVRQATGEAGPLAKALSQIAAVRNRASGAAARSAMPSRPGGAAPDSTSTAAHAVAKIAAPQPRAAAPPRRGRPRSVVCGEGQAWFIVNQT